MRCDAMRCDAMRCDAMRCDAMRCDAMRCDAMRCDAMRCDAMRCDAMRCNAMQCNVMFNRSFLKTTEEDCLHKPRFVPALVVDPRERHISLVQRENFVKVFIIHASVATVGRGTLWHIAKAIKTDLVRFI